MKKILCAILSICVLACGFPVFQLHTQAAEDTRYLVYEQNMEDEQTLEDVLVSLNKPANSAGYALEPDVSDPNNTVLATVGPGGRFEVQPERVCVGTEITMEYRFKFEGAPAAFELMRAFADSTTSIPMIYNDYTAGGFSCRVGKGSAPALRKAATADTWYRYVVILKNLPSEDPNEKVFDHIIYEQQPDGSEKVVVSVTNLPIMRWDNPGATQFHRFWVDTKNLENLVFDDFRIYSNNEADVSEEYILRSDRSYLDYSDLTSEPSDEIASDLNLPFTAQLGSSIVWTSSDPETIDPTTGVVTRQVDATDVTLTAYLSREDVDKTFKKEFTFTVLADDRSDQEVVEDMASRLDLTEKNWIMFDFPLPETAGYRTSVAWSVDPNPVIEVDGYGAIVTRPETDTNVTLHAVVSRGDAQAETDIDVTVLKKGADADICNPYEEFDQYSDGAMEVKNWTLNPGSGTVMKVTEDNTAALHLSKPSGNGITNTVLDFSNRADNTKFDIRMKSTVENATILSLMQGDSAEISVADENGELVADVCGIEVNLGEYPKAEWFTIKVEINHATRRVDIYVNGERRTDDGIFIEKQAPAISKAAVEIPESATGDIYIDYIKGYADFDRDLDLTIEQIDFGGLDRNNVTSDFALPTTGVGKTKLAWTTDNPSVIDIVDGVAKVSRPTPDMTDATVTLTLEVSNAFVRKEISFEFTVLRSLSDEEIVELDMTAIKVPSEVFTNETNQIFLPTSGENGSIMSWESSNTDVIGTDGRVYSIGYEGDDVENVELTVTVSHGNVTKTKKFTVAVNRTNFAFDTYVISSSNQPGHSPMSAVDNDPDTYWLASADETKPNLRISLGNTVTFNQIMLSIYGNSTTEAVIEYSTDELQWYPLCTVSNHNGQPQLIEFDEVTAKYLRYTVTKKTLDAAGLYEVAVYYDENPGDLLTKAVEAVSISNANNITGNFTLPLTGLYNTSFEWTSENESIIEIDEEGNASVTRPERDTTVDLTLRASLSGKTMTVTKTVTVKGTGSSGGSGTGGSGGNKGNGGSSSGSGNSGGLVINLPQEPQEVPSQKLYNDVNDTHWAKQYIEYVSANGIMTGRGNNLFEPDANIKREEFVKVLILSFGFELTDDVDVEFTDIDKNSWCYPYIATAKKLGIVNGINENEFGASLEITREDMAVMVVRAAQIKGKNFDSNLNNITFTDENEISDYATESVKILAEASILSGIGQNMFAPKRHTTRAEVAKIICLLDK